MVFCFNLKKNIVKIIWWMWGERFKWKIVCDVYWEIKVVDVFFVLFYKRGKFIVVIDFVYEEIVRFGLV